MRVFRVDNPHTKPLAVLGVADRRDPRRSIPDVIFLAEAFTRPAMMRALAKARLQPVLHLLHLAQHARASSSEYVTELATETAEYFRPNFFANTPDILHEYLQPGGRPAFEARLVLAATLSPSYGIYSGFESFENVPLRAGKRGVPRLGEVRAQASVRSTARCCRWSSG